MGQPNSLVLAHTPQGGRTMGRGRAKAKQTKVARQLKYNSPDMDLDSLQRELAGRKPESSWDDSQDEENDDDWDDYNDYR